MTQTFDYSNLSGRPPGPFVTVASRVLPGVRRVQDQIAPYAKAWRESNLAALAEGSRPLWVALGDSMTQGVGASAFDNGWVGQLARRLAASGRDHRVVNLSISGARVQDVLDRQLPALRTLGIEPELVTVLIGSNDMVRRRLRDALPSTFAAMLGELPRGTVIANLPNPNRAATAVNALIDEAVSQHGMVLANMRQPRTTTWRGKLADDHFHPNDRGYSDMAAVFAEALSLG